MTNSVHDSSIQFRTLAGEGRIGPGRPELLRAVNAQEILHFLRVHNPCSRADLVRLSGLSAPTVSNVIAYLHRKGLVDPVGMGSSNGGRPPKLIQFNAQFGNVIGVDIGGSFIRVAVADLNGAILDRQTLSSRRHCTPAEVVSSISDCVHAFQRVHKIPARKIFGIGVGAPGITDADEGIVRSAPNLLSWQNIPLKKILKARLKAPVAVENDVNLGALGESWCGTAQGVKNFVFLAIGTGVGAGIFLNGRLYHGSDWAAGEIGYMNLSGNGASRLSVYQPGPLENMIGGRGIVRSWREMLNGRRANASAEELPVNATEIFDQARDGHPEALRVLKQTARILANAITNLSIVLDTSLIVLGGKIGTHPALFEATQRLVERNEFARPQLAISVLGADAQLFGAIQMALTVAATRLFSSSLN